MIAPRRHLLKKVISATATLSLLAGQLPAQLPFAPQHALADASSVSHVLSEANSWNIQDDLILPGETFSIKGKLETSVRQNPHTKPTDIVNCINNAIEMDGAHTNVASKLVRSEADPTKFTPVTKEKVDFLKEYGPSSYDGTQGGGEHEIVTEWRNDTGLPVRLSQWMDVSHDEGKAFVNTDVNGEVIFEAFSTSLEAPLVTFYENEYEITYEGVPEDIAATLPKTYKISHEKQTIRLPKLNNTREGAHFIDYSGPQVFGHDGVMTEYADGYSYTFGWEDLIQANFGDETVVANFMEAPTLTFHTDGGTLDGQIAEVDTEYSSIDTSEFRPTKTGYSFQGWYTSADFSEESKVEGDSIWFFDGTDDPAIQLYAKWGSGSEASFEERVAAKLAELCEVDTEDRDYWEDLGTMVGGESLWYVLRNGEVLKNDWADYAGQGNWYYLDDNGEMLVGLQELTFFGDTGYYYFYTVRGSGTYGRMLFGWFQDPEGNWYYGNPKHDGTFGKLYTDGDYLIDGKMYSFGYDGRCLNP